MSAACCSGESSSPNEAWMPPCAFEELFACSEPLVASATRAPERWAETAAASPEAPLPTTSTSKCWASPATARLYLRLAKFIHCSQRRWGNAPFFCSLPDGPKEREDLVGRGGARVCQVPGAL